MATAFGRIGGNVRQQQQTKKPAGSDKALRAALRQQRRNQAKQDPTTQSNTYSEENDVVKDGNDTSKNKGEIGSNDKKKEKGDAKMKKKGPFHFVPYHAYKANTQQYLVF